LTEKMNLGRLCEYLVKVIVEAKSGWDVCNINDKKKNHLRTDLVVHNRETGEQYEISVKAKQGATWPAVKGIAKSNEYIVFASLAPDADPEFFVLTNRQWGALLRRLLPTREAGGEIIDGAIVWRWIVDGKNKSFKGTAISKEEIAKYQDKWAVLPGIEEMA
jgi:hypothetical protein